MLSYQECGSLRNYTAYVVCKALNGISLTILFVPVFSACIIGLAAEAVANGMDWFIQRMHRIRDAIEKFLVATMQRFVVPVGDEDEQAVQPDKDA